MITIKVLLSNIRFSFFNMWSWCKNYIFYSLLLSLTQPFFSIISLFFDRYLINSLFNKNANVFIVYSCYILIMTIIYIIINYFSNKFEALNNSIQLKYQYMLYSKNMQTDYENVENTDNNNDFVIAYNDTNTNNCAPVKIIRTVFGLIATILGVFVYSAIISSMSIYLLLFIIFCAIMSYFFNILNQKYYENNKDEIALLDRKLGYIYSITENYEFGKDIRLYNYKCLLFPFYYTVRKFRLLWEKKLAKRNLLFMIILSVFLLFQQALMYFFAVKMLIKNDLLPGDFVYYITSIGVFSTWISEIFSYISTIHILSIKTAYFKKYVNIKDKYRYDGGIKILSNTDSFKIEFKNVCYRYAGADKDAVHNISFVVNRGDKIALVGLNGAGKTTIIKLLCGLYFPTSGEILLNDIPITEYNILDYYSIIAPVFQDMHLLPVTIREFIQSDFNSNYSNEEINNRLDRAILYSGLKSKIDSLPNGINSRLMKGIYPDSIDLSGGEKQSLMIARAIYKDSPFVLLDEPAAALDPIAENNLYKTCDTIFKDKCVFFVSHRMSSVSFCDKIMLISGNVIKEIGTHNELMTRNGIYAQMYKTQRQYYRSEDGK